MNLSFKNRIALHYLVATASVMAIVFTVIFIMVKGTVLRNLDSELSYEAEKHAGEIVILGDSIRFKNKSEWEEREHREIQVNPVFIQIMNKAGQLMDKSPNLKTARLPMENTEFGGHFNTRLNDRKIRQVQIPIEKNGKIEGYILAAVSSEAAFSVIAKLQNVLLISYFVVLSGLFFISRFLAGRSIVPVQQINKTIRRITKDNLKERVPLPTNQDEIYSLSQSFNDLLTRIENALQREKQFTSDVSHELRTPLASLRGTLEVLIRKTRTPEEYVQKIRYSLEETEKMTHTLEQLLLIARLESTSPNKKDRLINLAAIIDESIALHRDQITGKNLEIHLEAEAVESVLVPQYYTKIIMDNLLSNAIKYSHPDSRISIKAGNWDGGITLTIQDQGLGIKEADLDKVFDNFFRSDTGDHKNIAGNGLGLSIVKKCAEAIQAEISIDSIYGQGTSVTVKF